MPDFGGGFTDPDEPTDDHLEDTTDEAPTDGTPTEEAPTPND